jgi:superfamily I DNA/RNA helicase
MFADDVAGVTTLCTYHRAKGREWFRVFLLEHARRCPSPWAKQDWQKHQESNLAYVAITRARTDLIFVN